MIDKKNKNTKGKSVTLLVGGILLSLLLLGFGYILVYLKKGTAITIIQNAQADVSSTLSPTIATPLKDCPVVSEKGDYPKINYPCIPCDSIGEGGLLVELFEYPGVKLNGRLNATIDIANGLIKAGKIAQSRGYELYVQSTCRSYETQRLLWNKAPKEQRTVKVSRPGLSNHGFGNAVDVQLKKTKKTTDAYGNETTKSGAAITSLSFCQQCKQDKNNLTKLTDIMFEAGFTRYCPEVWHYEIGVKEEKNHTKCTGLPPSCKNNPEPCKAK